VRISNDSDAHSNFWPRNMVLPEMAARGSGSVIIVSSIAGEAVLLTSRAGNWTTGQSSVIDRGPTVVGA
jgi:NADP-dependent 3-hydroxy acid dehydrogenase YdfG